MRSLCELAGGCCTARWVLHLTWDVEQCVVNEFLPVKSINPPADPCQLKAPFKSWVVGWPLAQSSPLYVFIIYCLYFLIQFLYKSISQGSQGKIGKYDVLLRESWNGVAVPCWEQLRGVLDNTVCVHVSALFKFLIPSVFPTLIPEKVLWLWINLVRRTKACDMLGDRGRYVWGSPKLLSAPQLCRSPEWMMLLPMDDVAAVHSEWLLPHLCEFDGMSNIQTSCYNSSLSEGKFRHKSTAKILGCSNTLAFL